MSATSSTVSNAVDEDSRIERTCVGIDGIEVTGSQSVREIYLGWSAKMKTVPDAFMNKLEETAITTLEHVRDKTFTNETVELDGKRFTNCVFDGCFLKYSGGDTEIGSRSRCSDRGIRPRFVGAAWRTVLLLHAFGLLSYDPFAKEPNDWPAQTTVAED